jgi:hypothetical protein
MHSKCGVTFRLRPGVEQDRAFLYALHCQTMRGMIEQTWGWDEAWQQEAFRRRFTVSTASIIENDTRGIGGLILESRSEPWTQIGQVQLRLRRVVKRQGAWWRR